MINIIMNNLVFSQDQSLRMISDFVFIDNDTIYDWGNMQKLTTKNVMEQQLRQVERDLSIKYCNYNFKIILILF